MSSLVKSCRIGFNWSYDLFSLVKELSSQPFDRLLLC